MNGRPLPASGAIDAARKPPTPAEVGPVPVGFGVTFDRSCDEPAPGVLTGGTPARLLRLSGAGGKALSELRAGPVRTPAGAALARRLFDAGLAHPVPPAGPDPDLTVVIPAHDRADLLAECLRTLGTRFPVLVVDDASSDPDAIAKVTAEHGAHLVRREANGGPAAARNTGLANADTELVAFVDSDAVPTADDLVRVAAHLVDPAVAAAAPRITPYVRSGGRYDDRVFGRKPCALDLGERPARVAPFTKVAYVPSTVLVVRRAVVDGFEESLRYGEDVDLIWRLHAAGHTVRYDPAVVVGHHEPTTWPALLERRFRYGTSAGPLSRRHPGTFVPQALEPFTATALVAVLAGRPRVAALALTAALGDELLMRRQVGLPARGAPRAVAVRAARTWRSSGTYATQLAGPAVLAAALTRPRLAAWMLADPRAIAENVAYGAGVLTSCVRTRTAAPLKPLIRPLRRRTNR